MVVPNEETALVLKVQLSLEAFSINLADDFLFQLLEVDAPSLALQLLQVVVGEVEDGGEYSGRRGTCRVHVALTDRVLMVGLLLNLVKYGKEPSAEVTLVGVVFV